MRIDWSDRAVADLRQISEYIERDRGLETANRVSLVICDAVQSLRIMPYRGRPGASTILANLSSVRFLILSFTKYSRNGC